MDEKLIGKRLKKAVFLAIGIMAALAVLCVVLFVFLRNTVYSATHDRLAEETGIYRQRIYEQLETDFRILDTFAGAAEPGKLWESESFGDLLCEINGRNDFVTTGYFPKGEETGIIALEGESAARKAEYASAVGEVQTAVASAWNCSRTDEQQVFVSRMFDSAFADEKVFLYALPLYEGDEAAGALFASARMDIFYDIIDDGNVLGGNGYIHLLGSEGDYLVRSEHTIVKEKPDNIFEGDYFSEEEGERLYAAMQNEERVFSSFRYEGKSYQVVLVPVRFNGWYLFCINTVRASNGPAFRIIWGMCATFAALLVVIVGLLIYIYRLLKKNNGELSYIAYHDALTGAENFIKFKQDLSARRREGCLAALNLRHFKFINEIFGKEKADQLLVQAGECISRHMHTGEFFCRDSADQFYIFLLETDREIISRRLNGIMDEIVGTFVRMNSDYRLLIYTGVIVLAQENEKIGSENAVAQALLAMERAKGGYKNNVCFYSPDMFREEEMDNYIESHMQAALDNGEFKMFLQPKVDLGTGRVIAAEALARWVTGDGRTIYPGRFIPVFERNGFCTQLDMYMLELACRRIRSWMDEGKKPIGISVNQSKLLFFESDYIGRVGALLEKYKVPAELITLEILEELALTDADELGGKLAQLRRMGLRISMDDFGSGYSSLNTLGRLDIDEVKLDRGFLREASEKCCGRSAVIMEESVRLAHRLNISVVVEGVETAENHSLIRSLGCDVGQGYYYGRPIETEKFDALYM